MWTIIHSRLDPGESVEGGHFIKPAEEVKKLHPDMRICLLYLAKPYFPRRLIILRAQAGGIYRKYTRTLFIFLRVEPKGI